MIINASGGNADAVMTVAQTLSNTQKTQARTNIGALSSASGAVAAANLASNAVETAKIKDAAVTFAKLANDAKYSPIVQFGSSNATATFSIASNGKTNIANNGSTNFVLTVPNSDNIPVGFETALLRYSAKSVKITFASGIKVLVYGNTSPLTAPSFTLETYAMVALKKLTSDTWLLTGPAEVV